MSSRRSNAPPCLVSLPTEIVAVIFSNFCRHCRGDFDETPAAPGLGSDAAEDGFGEIRWDLGDIHALYSLCLVSRRIRDIAQPILYHEFVPGGT